MKLSRERPDFSPNRKVDFSVDLDILKREQSVYLINAKVRHDTFG